MKSDYIILNHSIYSKDENGRILSEVLFPEKNPGEFTIERIYVCEDLFGQGIESELMQMAQDKIRAQHGRMIPGCGYAKKWMNEHHISY